MLVVIFKVVIALGLLNVWLLRSKKGSLYRGGDSIDLKGEFEVYGLAPWMFYLVGGLKILSAIGLLVSIWIPELQNIFAFILLLLLFGSVIMHIKVRDPLIKSIPALALIIMLLYIIVS